LDILRQFPGYTLSSLLAEDVRLLRLLTIERLGTPEQPDDSTEGGETEWLATP